MSIDETKLGPVSNSISGRGELPQYTTLWPPLMLAAIAILLGLIAIVILNLEPRVPRGERSEIELISGSLACLGLADFVLCAWMLALRKRANARVFIKLVLVVAGVSVAAAALGSLGALAKL